MDNKARWDQEGEVHWPSTMAAEDSMESSRWAVDRPWKAATAEMAAGTLSGSSAAGDKGRDSC